MKPLELAAYPICDCGPPDHYIDCDKTPTPAWLADLRAEDKRLTDSELAAEYWGAMLSNLWHMGRGEAPQLLMGRRMTDVLYRFATTPSHDE